MECAPVDELSFYDQPGSYAIFSTTSPSLQDQQQFDGLDLVGIGRRPRRRSSTSSIQSQQSTASDASTISCATSTSSCSSIEQVFFGAQTDKEKKLVAKLSRKAQPEVGSPSRGSERRETSSRLKKKDSLEFNRRRTLGFSARKNVEGQQSRRWEGGLVEKTNTPRSSTPLRLSNTPKTSTPLRHARNMNTVCSSPEDDVFSISSSRATDFRISTPSVDNAHVSARISPPGSPLVAATDSPNGSLPHSPYMLTDRVEISINDSAFIEDHETSNFVRLDSDQEGTQAGGVKSGGVMAVADSPVRSCSIESDETSGDSDKENTTTATIASLRDNRSPTRPRTALAEIALGKVFRELAISDVSARKSLRDRKGERSERISSRNGGAEFPAASTVVQSPSRRTAPRSPTPIPEESAVPSDENLAVIAMENKEDASTQEQFVAPPEASDPAPPSSKRFQAVLRENDEAVPTSPQSGPTTPGDQAEKANSSFDPDSPLPVSRAPRHSLLLALTTSPMHFDTSSSKSSSGSPSPLKMEPLFAPEYHTVATPNRARQALEASAYGITETPLGQATSRHRDARTLRKEQATMERQATISNKLSAVSMAMSGLKASGYGASSVEPRRPSHKEEPNDIQYQSFQVDLEKSKTPPRSVSKNPVVLAPPCTIFPESKECAPPIANVSVPMRASPEKTATSPKKTATSPVKAALNDPGEGLQKPSTVEIGQSRIPKSVVPPSQPVFRKPMISGLPVLKPSMLPTKSPAASTTQKAALPITMNFKAVRPDASTQADLPRFATPVKGRMPSALAFRSPAASRIMAATNPAKPIGGRSASGSLLSSVSGAVRPATPGKNRSVSAGESTGLAARSHFMSASSAAPPSGLTPSIASLTIIKSTSDAPLTESVPTKAETTESETDYFPPQTQPSSLVPQGNVPAESRPQVRTLSASQTRPVDTSTSPTKPPIVASAEVVATSRSDGTASARPDSGKKAVIPPRRAVTPRATRAVRPGAAVPATTSRRQPAPKTPEVKRVHISAVPDKELVTITELNTARNEVYFCTLDRNVIKKDGPRPESPGKVRTIAEREEEERKLSREARAKRRGTGTRSGESSDQEGGERVLSLAELLPPLKHIRGPGEDEDYQTPARPLKRGRKSVVTSGAGDDPSPTNGPKRKKSRVTLSKAVLDAGEDKYVRWDKGLVVLGRLEPSVPQHHREGEPVPRIKSCLKRKDSIQLDHLGNLPHATIPIPKLKRNRIPVACFWYDGEEPPVTVVSTPAPSVVASSSAASRRGKK